MNGFTSDELKTINKDFHLTQAEIESVDPRLMDFAEVVEK